tara:strand:- start:657 stop:974 length:318 start_codon:yes stop_codon:yes gene_type:complete
MPEVRMTVEEYLSLIEGAHTAVGTAALTPVVGRPAAKAVSRTGAKIQRKASGTALKGMSSALKKANKMARKKNGSFKKGWSQGKVMKKAHQIRKRATPKIRRKRK